MSMSHINHLEFSKMIGHISPVPEIVYSYRSVSLFCAKSIGTEKYQAGTENAKNKTNDNLKTFY